jgi:hypothetical protein
MSNINLITWLSVGLIGVIAPLMQQPSKTISSNAQGVVNTEFRLIVEDIVESKSGLTMCKMLVKETDKQVIGPCESTEGTKLQVGFTYTVSKASFDGSFISINKAMAAEAPLKWQVKETYVRARTPLMLVSNGSVEKIVGNNEGHTVGSFVSLQ